MRLSNLLAVALLTTSAISVAACGSTVQRDDGSADDGVDDGVEDDGIDDGSSDGSSDGSGDGGTDDGDGGEVPCLEPREAGCPYGPAECVDGTWICPPEPGCPAERPVDGSPCPLDGQRCEYGDGGECGYPPTYECRQGAWENIEDELLFRCSPVLCGELADRETCASSGCRWLEPGCSDDVPALEQAGCFELGPCVEGACPTIDQVCTAVMVDPDCGDCAACGVVEMLCVDGGSL